MIISRFRRTHFCLISTKEKGCPSYVWVLSRSAVAFRLPLQAFLFSMLWVKNNMSVNIYQRSPVPLQDNPFQNTRSDKTSKVIPYGMDAGGFSAPWQQNDFPDASYQAEQTFRDIGPELKKDIRPFEGQLPYSTTPRSYLNPAMQMVPQQTRIANSRVCFNEALDNSGPWYLRHWQIWDNAPFLPSVGDVTKDPRYGIQTKGFTTDYMKLPR